MPRCRVRMLCCIPLLLVCYRMSDDVLAPRAAARSKQEP
jgi:hypothetical protein